MNRIVTLVGSLRKAYPEIESCKFELIFLSLLKKRPKSTSEKPITGNIMMG